MLKRKQQRLLKAIFDRASNKPACHTDLTELQLTRVVSISNHETVYQDITRYLFSLFSKHQVNQDSLFGGW